MTGSDRTSAVLTNAHTHLELCGLGEVCPTAPIPFERWLPRLAWRSRLRSRAAVRQDIERGIEELARCGTTHVGDISATGLSVEPLMASSLRGYVFLEVLGLDPGPALERLERVQQTIHRARKDPRHGPLQVGLSLHAAYSCHPLLLRAGAKWCVERKVPLCVHVAESPAETNLLLSGRLPGLSPWVRMLAKALRALPNRAPGLRPVPYLLSLGVLGAKPLLVHGVQVSAQDVEILADAGCPVAHCPRSNHLLGCGRMPLERYLEAGVTVYLGTDSLASSPSLDVRDEAAFAREIHAGKVAPEGITGLLNQPLSL